MYVVAHHQILDPGTAFPRGERLMRGDGAPAGCRVLQFYPSADSALVICLWEAASVDDVQRYIDVTLGDSSRNTTYEVDAKQAFADRPLGLPATPAIPA